MKVILIADDDAILRRAYVRTISTVIAGSGVACEIESAPTGEQAIELLKVPGGEERDEVMLITDGDMSPAGGVWSGEDLIRELRALCGHDLKKALLVSTISDWSHLAALGAVYLEKPDVITELKRHVREFLLPDAPKT